MEAGEAIRKTLLELLAIDSDNRADKSAILAYVTERLEGCGMRVDRIGGSDTPAVLATVGGGGVVLSGHLDTVPIGEGWSRRQGEIDGDRVYGRGAADMKGAVAAMLHATAELAENDVPCSVALTTDEEERMLGAREIAKRPEIISSKGIVICEPTGLDIACREKGVFRFRLRTRGKAAHSSQSWLGDNAIMRMHQALSRLTDLAQTPSAPTDGLTMCFATIRGGTKNNVVPDRCETEIDARFPAPDTPDSIETARDADHKRSVRRRGPQVRPGQHLDMHMRSRGGVDGARRGRVRRGEQDGEGLRDARSSGEGGSGIGPGHGPRKRYHVPYVLEAADPPDDALESEPESRVRN